jgi:hypothetical protein
MRRKFGQNCAEAQESEKGGGDQAPEAPAE